jgi:hypothetical protein
MRRNYYDNDPREITAKFDSICKETGKKIKKGDICIYYPIGKSVYHSDSNQALEYRNMKMDQALGYDY